MQVSKAGAVETDRVDSALPKVAPTPWLCAAEEEGDDQLLRPHLPLTQLKVVQASAAEMVQHNRIDADPHSMSHTPTPPDQQGTVMPKINEGGWIRNRMAEELVRSAH